MRGCNLPVELVAHGLCWNSKKLVCRHVRPPNCCKVLVCSWLFAKLFGFHVAGFLRSKISHVVFRMPSYNPTKFHARGHPLEWGLRLCFWLVVMVMDLEFACWGKYWERSQPKRNCCHCSSASFGSRVGSFRFGQGTLHSGVWLLCQTAKNRNQLKESKSHSRPVSQSLLWSRGRFSLSTTSAHIVCVFKQEFQNNPASKVFYVWKLYFKHVCAVALHRHFCQSLDTWVIRLWKWLSNSCTWCESIPETPTRAILGCWLWVASECIRWSLYENVRVCPWRVFQIKLEILEEDLNWTELILTVGETGVVSRGGWKSTSRQGSSCFANLISQQPSDLQGQVPQIHESRSAWIGQNTNLWGFTMRIPPKSYLLTKERAKGSICKLETR